MVIQIFLLWQNALERAQDILSDLQSTFIVLDVIDVEWSRGRFAENLTRFYRDQLPPGSDKERHCGVGPFRLIIVEDQHPRYGKRRTSRGTAVVNRNVYDTRARYRSWTGGGHRVHASVMRGEADHDLFLLLGSRTTDYEGAGGSPWAGVVKRERRDLVGADGWQSLDELLTAFEVTFGYVLLSRRDDGVAGVSGDQQAVVDVLVEDRWWAAVTANTQPSDDETNAPHVLEVRGKPLRLLLREPGDRDLDSAWQRDILRRRVRDASGTFVPSPLDSFYLTLHRAVAAGLPVGGETARELQSAAAEHRFATGDLRDLRVAAEALAGFFRAEGYGRDHDR
jgi:hypothetical protein